MEGLVRIDQAVLIVHTLVVAQTVPIGLEVMVYNLPAVVDIVLLLVRCNPVATVDSLED